MSDNEFRRAVREPSAAMRQAAAAVHEMFTALVGEGFDEDRAERIVAYVLTKAASGGS